MSGFRRSDDIVRYDNILKNTNLKIVILNYHCFAGIIQIAPHNHLCRYFHLCIHTCILKAYLWLPGNAITRNWSILMIGLCDNAKSFIMIIQPIMMIITITTCIKVCNKLIQETISQVKICINELISLNGNLYL